jgi:hypothetical protein
MISNQLSRFASIQAAEFANERNPLAAYLGRDWVSIVFGGLLIDDHVGSNGAWKTSSLRNVF